MERATPPTTWLSRPARIHSCRPGPARGVERHHSAVSVFLR
jgi:hypothetical protein